MLLLLLVGSRRRASNLVVVVAVVGRAVVHVPLRLRLALALDLAVSAMVNKDVDATVLWVLGDVLVAVLGGGFGVLRDDVPGMEQTRDLWGGGVLVG